MLDELRAIYREELGQEITRDEAAEVGSRLVGLIKLLRRPPPKLGGLRKPDSLTAPSDNLE